MTKTQIQLSIPQSVRAALAKAASEGGINPLGVRAEMGEDGVAELHILGAIGDSFFEEGSTAEMVAGFLNQNKGKEVRVLINSGGGLVFEGLAMFNLLAAHDGRVVTRNIGIAGSAASTILMAGDVIEMADNALLFVHRSMGMALGNTDVMLETAELLDQIDQSIAGIYAARSGRRKDSMLSLMRGEKKKDGTSMTAKEAKEMGLIDAIVPSKSKKDADGKAKNEIELPVLGDADPDGQTKVVFQSDANITPAAESKPHNFQARLRRLAIDEREAAAYLAGKNS